LNLVPDFTDWNAAKEWIEKGRKATRDLSPWSFSENDFLSLEWKDIDVVKEIPFGFYPAQNWRKFVLATFLADLVCYPIPVDQVNFERILFIMHAFPKGFRVWWMKVADSTWWPVGYTGWYPMFDFMFNIFEKNSEVLKDRMVVPDYFAKKSQPFLYLFNYSIVSSLRKTQFSKKLMTAYAQDIHNQDPQGLTCITVSDDGKRVASRFGMTCTGYLKIEDSVEDIFAARL